MVRPFPSTVQCQYRMNCVSPNFNSWSTCDCCHWIFFKCTVYMCSPLC